MAAPEKVYKMETTAFVEDLSVKRVAVIDVMNFLHHSAERTKKGKKKETEKEVDYLDAADLASLLYFLIQREFDVRAIVSKSGRNRAKYGKLLDVMAKFGLVLYTEHCYDDLLTIRYAADNGGFIISNDKYRDCLSKIIVKDAERYVIYNRVIRPVVNPFELKEGEVYKLTADGDRAYNFTTFLFSSCHNVLYADPSSWDYDLCMHVRRTFTLERQQQLKEFLVRIFDLLKTLAEMPEEKREDELVRFCKQWTDNVQPNVDRRTFCRWCF
ncbi:hypothetical protein L596_007814 [Steinernema carpocapsae]|uniref:RNase NYN domain-containing protein n=1 Tax=Steinernema carpocapsae TaxID=34508 RepID=A0A4U5PAV5_STECR|nr:hypothetical protein L596_007814 [Steinernema carpocapsae]